MRANPLPREEEERILAEVRRQLELEDTYFWVVGEPVPPGWESMFEDTRAKKTEDHVTDPTQAPAEIGGDPRGNQRLQLELRLPAGNNAPRPQSPRW